MKTIARALIALCLLTPTLRAQTFTASADLQASILHLPGLDHERLTYRSAGHNFRLTNVYGNVVREILS